MNSPNRVDAAGSGASAASSSGAPVAPDPELLVLREQIDAVDRQLFELLNQRAAVVLKVGELKARTGAPVYRPEREAQILIVAREQADIARDPDGEVRELTEYWQTKGLSPEVADAVAAQLHARDALEIGRAHV